MALVEKVKKEDFYIEAWSYLQEICTNPLITPILEKVGIERIKDTKRFCSLHDKLTKELIYSKNKILKDIKKKGIHDAVINENINEIQKILKGKIQTTESLFAFVDRHLRIIADSLISLNHTKIISQFLPSQYKKSPLKSYDLIFSKTREEYENERKKVNLLVRTKVWGALERLKRISFALMDYIDNWEEIGKDFLKLLNAVCLVSEMKKMISEQSFSSAKPTEHNSFNINETRGDLERIQNFILDNLDKGIVGASLIQKYKKRCEWYEQDDIIDILKKKGGKYNVETKLKIGVMKFMFDSGVMPIAEIVLGKQRPDIIGLYHEDVMPIEVKIYTKTTSNILKGFNQIVHYTATLDEIYGYYIIFNNTDKILDIPGKIEISNRTILIFVVNLSSSPSQRRANVVKLNKNCLLDSYKKRS